MWFSGQIISLENFKTYILAKEIHYWLVWLYDVWNSYSDTFVSIQTPQLWFPNVGWCCRVGLGGVGLFFSTKDSSLSCQKRALWHPSWVRIVSISFFLSIKDWCHFQAQWVALPPPWCLPGWNSITKVPSKMVQTRGVALLDVHHIFAPALQTALLRQWVVNNKTI